MPDKRKRGKVVAEIEGAYPRALIQAQQMFTFTEA